MMDQQARKQLGEPYCASESGIGSRHFCFSSTSVFVDWKWLHQKAQY